MHPSSTHPSRLRRLFGIGIALSLLVTGCAAPSQPTEQNFPEGGFAVEVPVLWVGTDADGTEIGGTEQTQVWSGKSKKSGYSVDLTSVEATGAGAAWRAASASAATVATLMSGTDPASVDIQFHISSPIDGPSAGGILTVGLLASFRHIPLKEHVTMTGTISPDGSIGAIGGAYSKIAAAGKAGFTTVVIPESNRMGRDPKTRESIDLVEFGAKNGVTVVPVNQLSEAFTVLTGKDLFAQDTTSAQTLHNTTDLSSQRAENISALLDSTSVLLQEAPSDESAALVAETQSALTAGDLDLASGLARESYLSAARQQLQLVATAAAANSVADGVRVLQARLTSALLQATTCIKATTSRTGLTDSQYASLPEMLLGVVTAQATLHALELTLPSISTQDDLLRAAGVLADQETALNVFFPRDTALLDAVKGPLEIQSENPIAFLSHYSQFLLRSGEANMTYLASVLQTDSTLDQHTMSSFDTSYPVLVTLAKTAQETTITTEQLSSELEEATYTLALYTNSSALISQAQALSLFNAGIGATGDLSENTEATLASIESGLSTVTSTAQFVDAEGWDPAYPLAQASAGAAFARNQLSDVSSTNDLARGLQRLWAASIAVLMMKAAPR